MPSAPLLTVDRALQILSVFTLDSHQWGITELARATGLDKSQTHRMVSTLAGRGFLVADPVSRRYGLGPRLVALGRVAEQTSFARTVLIGLAHLPEDQVRELFGRQLVRADGSAGESWEQLLKRYESIRAAGLAVSFGEYDSRVAAVASPVLVQGAIIGSVSVLAPRQEMRDVVEMVSAVVKSGAEELAHLYSTGLSTAR